jgi:intracellular septation protein A
MSIVFLQKKTGIISFGPVVWMGLSVRWHVFFLFKQIANGSIKIIYPKNILWVQAKRLHIKKERQLL